MKIQTQKVEINSVYFAEISNANRKGEVTPEKHVYLNQVEKKKGAEDKVKIVKEWVFEKKPNPDVVLALTDAHIKYLKEKKKVTELKKG